MWGEQQRYTIPNIRILKVSWNAKVSKQFKELGKRRGINKKGKTGWKNKEEFKREKNREFVVV